MKVALVVNGDLHRRLLNARPVEERSDSQADVEVFNFRMGYEVLESSTWDLVVLIDCASFLGDVWWSAIGRHAKYWVVKDTR